MSRRQDPAAKVVEFFQTASLETAQTVLKICVSIVARRIPEKRRRGVSLHGPAAQQFFADGVEAGKPDA